MTKCEMRQIVIVMFGWLALFSLIEIFMLHQSAISYAAND